MPRKSPATTRTGRPATKAPAKRRPKRLVYRFVGKATDGRGDQKDLLGGKGAGLAEMCRLGLPVPPGFTITTDVCSYFAKHEGRYPRALKSQVERALVEVERHMGKRFGDPENPLLVSVRSGARVSMPGMMDTVLNLGLTDATVEGLAARSGNPRFAWDAYRRLIQMYGSVVMGVKPLPGEDHCPFGKALEELRFARNAQQDTDLTTEDLIELVARYSAIVEERAGRPFPQDPEEQLWGATAAVFNSWNNERAIAYRRMNDIPGDWGTAVNIVAMVFGNLGSTSGTGVAFTRDPATGERKFYGEYLMNAQGEDVVAGLRTPEPIADLARMAPPAWRELQRIQKSLEAHYRDMQDLEFTIEDGRLFMLQCRTGKRTGFAAVKIAVDLVREKKITREEALLRVAPSAIDQLLQPVFCDQERRAAHKAGRVLCRGLNAGPGAASGRIAFRPADAERLASRGEPVILVRIETSPEDISGMEASVGILTARGGMTSHAALVARQMGKVCVAGAGDVHVDYTDNRMTVGSSVLRAGDWLSLDGSTGDVIEGELATQPSAISLALFGKGKKAEAARQAPTFKAYRSLMKWADEFRTMGIRTNADQPDQCLTAIAFGAEGVGLCRTEHMFFGDDKIGPMREMILAETSDERERALKKLLPLQRKDFEGLFKAMGTRPVTIRTLDPPLHEFLPHDEATIAEIAASMGHTRAHLVELVESLREINPMLGHRGCRLGITHPEITRMQALAIFEAAVRVAKRTGKKPRPEIMIPLVGTSRELELQTQIVRDTASEVFEKRGLVIPYLVGTMIELPRAALVADEIAETAEFFSFGTNDLTQTTFGISRDDAGRFVPHYVAADIYADDPFASLDTAGVGRLMEIAVELGQATRPDIKLGICGEHGGDPRSIEFCQALGLEYVSCSPFRVPIARLAAAQAALRAR